MFRNEKQVPAANSRSRAETQRLLEEIRRELQTRTLTPEQRQELEVHAARLAGTLLRDDLGQARKAHAQAVSGAQAPPNQMNELEIPGLALALIDLAQAKGALPADAMQAFCLALASLIVNTSQQGRTETVLRACIETITERVRKAPPS